MQGAESIRNRTRIVFTFALNLAGLLAIGQYTPAPLDTSKKIQLLKHYSIAQTYHLQGIRVDRNTMPIFCKWELDIEDQTGIPIKFRLGSQDYVDKLERKTVTY